MNTIDLIEKTLGKESFVSEDESKKPLLARRTNKRIMIIINREVIGPFINRSTDPADTIRYRFNEGNEVIRVPSRKFKSKDKLRGLEVCRAYGLVDAQYEYNAVSSKEQMNNPNSILFGDTETSGDAAGLPSKFIYGEGLSLEDAIKVIQPLTHNALSEEGTMWNRSEGKFRTSLFETLSILPGANILQTITIDSPTPESFAHLMICLGATRYGAQTSVTGPNIRNRVIGIIATTDEPPITAYTLVRDAITEKNPSKDPIKLVEKAFSEISGKKLIGKDAEKLQNDVQKSKDLEEVYKKLKEQATQFHTYVYSSSNSDKTRGRKSKSKESGDSGGNEN